MELLQRNDRHQGPSNTHHYLFPFESDRLSAKSVLILYKALIRSQMTYACPAWEYAADIRLLKLQRLQSRVLRIVGNLPRRTPTRALHLTFHIPYVYDYVTKIRRKEAEVIQNHDNINFRNMGKNEAQRRKHKSSDLVAVRHTILQVSKLP
jgi:hypothetical protein